MGVVVNTVKVALSGGLPAGSNVIGGVTQSGAWSVSVSGTANVSVQNATIAVTQSGTWNINAITTLPSLAAGSATIGSIASIGTSITPGTAAANLGKAEDAAHSSGDTGVMSLAVRNDSNNTLSGSDGDYTPFNVDAQGRLRTLLYGYDSSAMDHYEVAVTAGAVNVTQSGSWTVTANAGTGTMAVIERGTTIASTSASVTTTSGQIVASSATRRTIVLTNLGTDFVWIGASGVTDNQGIRLAPGQALTIDRSPTAAVHAKAASGTQTVAIFTESD